MKKIKRMMAIAIDIALSLTTIGAFGVFADTTYTITIKKDSSDKADHTYGAYQIFSGKLESKDGKDVLSDIQWGSGVNGPSVVTELKKIDAFKGLADNASASTVAKAISDANLEYDSTGAQAIADAINAALTSTTATGTIAANETSGTISGLPAGYYLIKDTAAVGGEGALTRFILEVVKNVEVAEKASVPTVTKKVKEKNDTTGEETGWQDAADYDIGDSIPYQITGTLPSTFADYDTYTVYKFTDRLSAGLTAPAANGITVKVGTADVTSKFDINVAGEATSEQTITIALKSGQDLKKWTDPALTAASTFVVEYNATLNDAAVIGSAGNPNDVDLEFSNNPNYDSTGTGKTPKDKVIVFTYEIKANKVDEDETNPLEGAGFTLYKKVPTGTTGAVDGYLKIGEEITGVTTFEFKGTDAGEYKLVETTVPAGYNKAADITFTVVATYDTEADDPQLKTLEINPSDAGFTFTTTSKEDGTHITTDGIASGKVINKKGATLPSTGGSGTTMIYIIGVILLAGAGILLVTRRRMKAE